MDPTITGIIVLLFVFSIVGSVTQKKDSTFVALPPPQPVYTTVETVVIPSPLFSAGYVEGLNDNLKRFIVKKNGRVSEWEAQEITRDIIKYSQQYDVNPKLVAALIARESGFNRYAVSSSGAKGLGQLLPSTAAGLDVTDPFDIDENVKATVRYMRSMLDRFPEPNKVPYAIAGYFEGPNSVNRSGGFKIKSKSYIEDILTLYNKI